MSARYDTVVAMLDDDANFACVIRELCRRGELESPRQLVLPPEEGASGSMCYMSFRWHLQGLTDVDSAERSDILAEVWKEEGTWVPKEFSQSPWWITLQDGSEVGPFTNRDEASAEARRFLIRSGWRLLPHSPWDTKDQEEWPIGYK